MKKIEREAEMREFSPQITLTENSREREAECSISLSLSLSLSLINVKRARLFVTMKFIG